MAQAIVVGPPPAGRDSGGDSSSPSADSKQGVEEKDEQGGQAASPKEIVVPLPLASTGQGPEIRVLLVRGVPGVTLGAPGGMVARDGRGKAFPARGTLQFSLHRGRVKLVGAGAASDRFQVETAVPGALISYGGRSYRGRMELVVYRGELALVNRLPLEDYLRSVVGGEMPAGWHLEALRAQAIAARSYALAKMERAKEQGWPWDVVSTVQDQVYLGTETEDPRVDRAVSSTRGVVALYEGRVITAYYSSDAGRMTNRGPAPYLRPVYAYNPESPYSRWSLALSQEELARLVGQKAGQNLSPPLRLSLTYGEGGRVSRVEVRDRRGRRVEMSGAEFRKLLGYNRLRSTSFRLVGAKREVRLTARRGFDRVAVLSAEGSGEAVLADLTADGGRLGEPTGGGVAERTVWLVSRSEAGSPSANGEILLVGSGYGHGWGLSQWGAKRLAEEGMRGEEIITYFFSGVSLASDWGRSVYRPPVEALTGLDDNPSWVVF